MKRGIIVLLVFLLFSSISVCVIYAVSNDFSFNASALSFTKSSKKESVVDNFNEDYKLSYSNSGEESDLEKEIKTLTKKTTYLLFGGFNNTNESSEEYYKRHKDYLDLRYAPEVQEGDNSSEAYRDDLVSGVTLPQIFNQANELGLIYNSYGNIRVTVNDDMVISSITLPDVKLKEENEEDPMEYDYVKTNYIMYYYYKKLNDEWKLYYLYGESTDQVDEYLNEVESLESNTLALAPSYESELGTIYNYEKAEDLSLQKVNNIYNSNKNNIVYLNSYYNNTVTSSANGFFIDNGLIVTTWNFLEKSLINAQYITVSGLQKNYKIEGIVTANIDTNIAVIKVEENNSFVKLGDTEKLKKEDPIVTISSRVGTGLLVQKGIVISNEDYIYSSIPLITSDEGSPLFNENGEVIGFNTNESTSASISLAVNSNVLEEVQDKFKNIDYKNIKVITFEELKDKYYYIEYNDEKIINNIPKRKWEDYSKIGNIKDTIKLKLVKANYKDGIVSLRYKNNISEYISSMQLSSEFQDELSNEEYKKVMSDESKAIYQNDKYKVIIMEEFDYLIVVMVKL